MFEPRKTTQIKYPYRLSSSGMVYFGCNANAIGRLQVLHACMFINLVMRVMKQHPNRDEGNNQY